MLSFWNLSRLVAFIGCMTSTLVWAHHPGHLRDVQYTETELALQLSVEHAPYNFGFGKGAWSRSTLESFYRPLSWLTLTSSVPVARLDPTGGEKQTGLGDMELAVIGRVFKSEDDVLHLSFGSGIELPTGDDHAGLGGGHVAVVPQATISWLANSDFVLSLDVLYGITLGGHEHSHGTSSVLALHSKQEIRSQMTLAYTQPAYFASVGAAVTYGLAEPREAGPMNALVVGGIRFFDSWALLANLEYPLGGNKRFDWWAGFGLRWTLASESPEECGCGLPRSSDECGCSGCERGSGCARP